MLKRRHLDSTQPHHRRALLLKFSIWVIVGYLSTFRTAQAQVYLFSNAQVQFTSEAPLETIQATNKEVIGAIDLQQRTFLVQIKNTAFQGFNSPLQQEHFFENYLESHKHPRSSFKGKLIDTFDPNATGVQYIRIKGILNIHGIEQERIVRVELNVAPKQITFKSAFTVPLHEHQISIPRIVHQKIAEEIKVQVQGELKLKQP